MAKVIDEIADIAEGLDWKERRYARFVSSKCPGWVSRISETWDEDERIITIDVCIKNALVEFYVRQGWNGPDVRVWNYNVYDITTGAKATGQRLDDILNAADLYVTHVRNWLMSEVDNG